MVYLWQVISATRKGRSPHSIVFVIELVALVIYNTMNTQMFSINIKDVSKALVMAVLTGAFLPILAVFQTPGFDITTANWSALGVLAMNGAILGFVSYIVKNFFSDKDGKLFGKIG